MTGCLGQDRMWIAKGWYLTYFSSLVCIQPYMNVFFASRGLSKRQIGLIGALRPWLSAPAGLAFSALADRMHWHRGIMMVTFVSSTVLREALMLPRGFYGMLLYALASECMAAPACVLADAATVAACKTDGDYGKYRLWGAIGWGSLSAVAGWVIDHYGIAAGFALGALLALPCLPLTWQLHTMSSAKQHHQPALPCSAGQDLHGMKEQTSVAPGQRKRHGGYVVLPAAEAADAASSGVAQSVDVKALHGSGLRSALQGNVTLGDLTLACRAGVYGSDAGDSPSAAALAHLHHRYPYEQAAAGSSQAAQGLVGTSHLPTDPLDVDDIPDAEASHAESARLLPTLHEHRASALIEPAVPPDSTRGTSTSAPSLNEKAWLLLSRPTVVAFLWTGVVMGAGFGVIDTYLFLLLQQLGANDTLMGLTLTVTCMAEVPAFQLQGKLLAWAGVQRVLDLAQATYVLRMLLYSMLPLLPSPWWVLPVEALHGITFACGWGAGTVCCKQLAPHGLAATMQGLFQGLYFGLGYGVGALAGGAAAARYGYPVLFAGAAACVLMGWLVGCAARYFVQRHEARYPSVHADVRSGSEGGHCDRLHQGLSEGLHCHGHSRLGRVGAEGVESKEPFLAARLLQEERPRKGHYVQLEMTEPQ